MHDRFLLVVALAVSAAVSPCAAQTIQNATLRRAQQASDNLDYRQALSTAQSALRERLNGYDRARAYELLGFTYSGMDSILRAVDTFKQMILLEPERELDPTRTSSKALSAFQVALTQVLVIRQLHVDSVSFVGGQGAVAVRYTVTQPARVVTRVMGGGGQTSLKIDSTVASGQVNIRWPARLASGDPFPAGDYNVVVEATVGQNNFSTSQAIHVTHGAVDTLPHLTALPGYTYLPETEVPPKSWQPMGLALVYTGIALAGTSALSNGDLGSASLREGGLVGAGTVLAGFIMTLRKPAPQPARGNILYNQLLREQISRRNTEIAQENTRRRQQVALSVVPMMRTGAGR
jgi:opacity protein-like surface antigen